jgi:hypothetical protein
MVAYGTLEALFQGSSLGARAVDGMARILANFFQSISHSSGGAAGGFMHCVSGVADASADTLGCRSDAIRDTVHDISGLVGYCLIVFLFHDSFQKKETDLRCSVMRPGHSVPVSWCSHISSRKTRRRIQTAMPTPTHTGHKGHVRLSTWD